MADIDDSVAAVCPVIQLVQKEEKPGTRIYRVTWVVHNFETSTGRYHSTRKERFFETEAAAKRFNARRQAAAELLGIMEDRNMGHPMALEVENDEQTEVRTDESRDR